MPRKKVEENHVITEPDFAETPDFTESEDSVYEPNMAPLAKEESEEHTEPESNSDSDNKVTLKLVNGATFTSGGKTYSKGVLEPVSPELAEKLMNTGFFERM
ncbi:hypothetical protein [Porcipelethomonas sp.]|uniref:hypothetical protein n=1 Tax=Porcipelethomonas sp. TaxID=2981675 RepID=UPI003EF0AA12